MPDDAPWTKYQTATTTEGPWTKYGAQADHTTPPPPAESIPSEHGWFARQSLGAGAAAGETFGETMLGAQELTGHVLRAAGFDGAGGWLIDDAQKGAKSLKEQASPYRKGAPVAAFVGDVVGTAPVFEGVGAVGAGGPIVNAALGGAVAGGLQPTQGAGNFAAEKAAQVGLGAAGGAVAGTAGKALSSAIAPKLGSDAAALAAKGVQMTPGQMAGGALKRAEDSLASVPVVGSFIGGAQRKSIETFNRAVIDDALAPIGEKLPKSVEMGHGAVAVAADRISDAYNEILPKMTLARDAGFDADLANLRSLATNMPPDQEKQFEHIIQNNLLSRLEPTGTTLGPSLKIIESDLGKFASQYRHSSVASERQLGDAVREAQNILRETLTRQNPGQAERLQAINSAFARLVRVEGAAGNRVTSAGVFTPADLLSAIKRGDTSARKAANATGRALGQNFAASAQKVLPQRIPNSGTPERLLWSGLLGGEYFRDPKIALGLGAATLPYTDPAIAGLNRLAQPAGPVRQGASNAVQAIGGRAAPVAGINTAEILRQLGLSQGASP